MDTGTGQTATSEAPATGEQLLNTYAYVRVKKLGIGNALAKASPGLFPGGEEEMLNRIEITGFETVPIGNTGKTTVITKYKILKVPMTSDSGAFGSSGSGSSGSTQG